MSIIEANEPEIIESSNLNKSDDKLDEDVYFGDEEINGNSKELNDGTNGKSNEVNDGRNGNFNELNDGTNGNFNEPYETPPKKVKTSPSNRDMNSARTDYLDWDEYFMAIAFLSAKRSKDPVTQVGACIVNRQRRIVGIGYNGMPTGCGDADFPWGKKNTWNKLENKYLYVCHAEMNAILNKNASDVRDCRMYVALFPCNECAKLIIQAGISEVVYMSDKHAHKVSNAAAKRMFNASNVKYWQYVPKNERIVIDFSEIDWNAMTQLPDTDTPAKNGNLEELQFPTRPKTMNLGD